uniref:glycerol kinase n=1 Tax=Dunaliella tertiolecta TaxID=3047 RepID=A0A7S3VPC6_DUNTE|mmetsp:Transcript_19548/g.54530  ORF Transcript_19548/g.54530 Transcript_19548/m.54530 type:complete len:512 (-) Transcript_19548:2548-4083(-)|eukprot:CAMPEP_0202364370 /NCGR_PEP_ID=MMETSP1126-20121109/15804_1 /ASSEMBLY_ACC=CAM_ASM_000457 /TAXON_ID=3047 /ORGANISM="Dunaliella tertiolecta, Strain CCMP1320" /LENGTH=511 /DNA_ID=CAMNT_0048958997 /DNA_START=87 /DNA_END=1622 /DNA_ORIENTATION=+
MTDIVAAIDSGTQSTRAYLFDTSMQPVASHQAAFTQKHPHPGWCEQDPMDIWLTVKECLANALKEAEARIGPVTIRALGLATQRETTIVWSKVTGLPLCNAIVWLDSRTSEICNRMEEELGGKDYFRPVTGLPINNYFSAFKFKWMYENCEAVRDAVDQDQAYFGTLDSWLIYQLTGGLNGGIHVTDVTNAARTMLMDLDTCQWHEPFLPLFDIPASCLPRIVSNAEVYGYVAGMYGALKGIPISGCLGDQMAAVLGHRLTAGMAKNTYGTGCFMLLNTGPKRIRSRHGLLTTVCYKLGADTPPCYALEGAVAVAGLGVSWLTKNLGILDSFMQAEELALTVPDTGGVYFVPAFSGLLAPHWDDSARGVILGLTGFSNKAHIVRAMLEAICFQSREVLDSMRQDADIEGMHLLRVDGGATKSDLLMQVQADLLQTLVVRPNFQETTVLGAALAAGLGAGVWSSELVFASSSYNNKEFKPAITDEEADKRFARWSKAVTRCLDLADLSLDEA